MPYFKSTRTGRVIERAKHDLIFTWEEVADSEGTPLTTSKVASEPVEVEVETPAEPEAKTVGHSIEKPVSNVADPTLEWTSSPEDEEDELEEYAAEEVATYTSYREVQKNADKDNPALVKKSDEGEGTLYVYSEGSWRKLED